MTNMPYEERIKNRDNNWYYNKCIRQYHFIIKSEGANQRYKEEIKRLTKAKETMENEYGDLLKAFAKSETEYKKEIARLNKIIEEIETIFDTPYFDDEVSKQLGDNGFFTFKQMYKACNIVFKKRLKELKKEGKNKC